MRVISLIGMLMLWSGGLTAATSPNVLFIVADDLNVAVGSYGHATARTPNIDALAERGVRFDRAYVQYPLCNPSRTSFLSGLRPQTTQVYSGSMQPRHAIGDVRMLPEHFSDHGYFTARVGKLAHDRFPESVRWDVSEEAPADPYYLPGVDHSPVHDNTWIAGAGEGMTRLESLAQVGRSSGMPLVWRATDQTDAQTPDGGTALRIVELLQERVGQSQPFFIAAGFHKPHQPWIAPQTDFVRHPIARVGLPRNFPNDQDDIPAAAFSMHADDAAHDDDQIRQARAAYHATVSLMDRQVGVVISALDRLDLADDTIVVFFSDHGFHLGEHGGLWRKMTLFEESTRVPLIVVAPGRPSGRMSSALVELVDLYPTLSELAGIPTPAHLEGTSFVSLLSDPERAWKPAVFSELVRAGSHGRNVRTARYSYTQWRSAEGMDQELYDLHKDPGEFTNLARSHGNESILELMAAQLAGGWRAAVPENP